MVGAVENFHERCTAAACGDTAQALAQMTMDAVDGLVDVTMGASGLVRLFAKVTLPPDKAGVAANVAPRRDAVRNDHTFTTI